MLMILLGGVLLWQGWGLNGLLLMLIGWFGLSANRSQTQMLQLQTVLRELKVEAAAGKRFRVLEADQTLRRLSQLRLTASEAEGPADWVLVCKSGRWVGWIDDQPLKLLPVQQWDQQRLEDHLRPLTELPSIASSAPLVEAVPALEAASQGRLLVMSAAGLPSGTLDRMDVGDAVLKRLGVTLPPAILDEARKRNGYPLGLAMLPQMVQSMQAQSAEPDACFNTVKSCWIPLLRSGKRYLRKRLQRRLQPGSTGWSWISDCARAWFNPGAIARGRYSL